MTAAPFNRFQTLALRGGQRLVAPKNLRVAQNAVERGAQFVAHIRQKRALGLVRPFRRIFRLAQFFFRAPALADVPNRVHQQNKLPHVGLMIFVRFIGDADDSHDFPVHDDRNRQKTLQRRVSFWIPLFQGIRRVEIIHHNRRALPDGFAPYSGLFQRIHGLRLGNRALPHDLF